MKEIIDYSTNKKQSIWGSGDPETLKLLEKEEITGRWLNLAAGDGRYNQKLLAKADNVIASDIDENALAKLYNNTPKQYQEKLKTKSFNIVERFPFDNNYFDGVFCTGALHLFPRKKLEKIVEEIDRVLKSKGKVILDFATDVRRALLNGELYIINKEPQYKLIEARSLLEDLFRDYKIRIIESNVPEEEIRINNKKYLFSCNFFLLVAEKK